VCSGPGSKCLGLLWTARVSSGTKADCEGTGHGALPQLFFSFPSGGERRRHSGGILVGDYLLGGRTTNNQLRTGTDKGNPTV
jgi:hypothetical protein